MNDFAFAYLRGIAGHLPEMHSALPWAPVAAHRLRKPVRARIALAGWLRAAADRVSPRPTRTRPAAESGTAC